MNKAVLKLYLITDQRAVIEGTLYESVKTALENGVTCLQYREKNKNDLEKMEEAKSLLALARQYQVPFIVNDDLALALAIDADGVHLGQSDVEATIAREALGPNKIIGITAKTVEQGECAERSGADYIGVGAAFKTTTKTDAKALSLEEIKTVVQSVKIPAVAIGGIDENNAKFLRHSGISGIAVISGILSQKDVAKSTKNLAQWDREVAE